jgi:hypothetical protein
MTSASIAAVLLPNTPLLPRTQPLCRYFNLSGAHALLATVNGPGVVAAFTLANMPPERGLRACANLAGLVPPGDLRPAAML